MCKTSLYLINFLLYLCILSVTLRGGDLSSDFVLNLQGVAIGNGAIDLVVQVPPPDPPPPSLLPSFCSFLSLCWCLLEVLVAAHLHTPIPNLTLSLRRRSRMLSTRTRTRSSPWRSSITWTASTTSASKRWVKEGAETFTPLPGTCCCHYLLLLLLLLCGIQFGSQGHVLSIDAINALSAH